MDKLKPLFKKPSETFELILSDKINWLKIFVFFSSNGFIFIYYVAKSKSAIDISSIEGTIGSLLGMILLGIIYGQISNFTIGYFIKLTGNLLGAKNNLKKIYNALGWSYFPSVLSSYLIIINILLARILLTDVQTSILLVFTFLILIFSFLQAALGIWQLILIFKGLKIAQGLNSLKTIINYIAGAGLFGLIYYLLINPYI